MATRDALSAPALPSGLVAFVKRECPTCELVAPVLAELAKRSRLTVYTQDDPDFPAGVGAVDDTALELSWHHRIESVPTLLLVEEGVERERLIGWQRQEWQALTGVDDLGADLPEWRPGCGSRSVDPDLAPELAARFAASRLRSRRVELGEGEDEMEALFARGWTDGLPVVAPTERRVLAMLEGTGRDPGEQVAVVPPTWCRAASRRSRSTRSWPAAFPSTCRWCWPPSRRPAPTPSTPMGCWPRPCPPDRC
jgi:thiol-disulfide isomerase/thioredoxin